MDTLFNPSSVAVVGVSTSTENLGKNIVKNLVSFGFKGKIHPVGPRGGTVEGLSICPSVGKIGEMVDIAVILTPARTVPEIVAECGEIGVRWAVIQAGGFRESGAEGIELENKLLEVATRYGIRFVGPNCLGVIDTTTGFSVPFIALPTVYRCGRMAIMAQSGGMGLSLAERLTTAGVGFGKFVSLGNKLSLDEVDYLTYLMNDSKTDIIYFYLEDFKRGREFFELAACSPKPILLHKSNTSALSRTIAQSHTAALAADDRLVDHLAQEAGVVRVRSVSEAVKLAKGFSLPPLRGRRLAVLSRSGGHAVVAADTCGEFGFEFPPLGENVLETIRQHGRAGVIRLGNPLDLGDIYNLDVYSGVVERVLEQSGIDGVVHIHVSHMRVEKDATRRLLGELKRLTEAFGKPVAVVVEVPLSDRVDLEKEASFPFFMDVREAVEALGLQVAYFSRPPKVSTSGALKESRPTWLESADAWVRAREGDGRQPAIHECLELLEILGVPTAPWRVVGSLPEAHDIARAMGYPVVLKAVASSLSHKSDRGGVVLGIEDASALDRAWQIIIGRGFKLEGVVVQQMIKGSREMIVGAYRDSIFGPVGLVGMGGVLVELLRDVSFRLAPLASQEALEMIRALRCGAVFGAYRGMEPVDLAGAAEVLSRLSLFVHHFPVVHEVDINPILFADHGGKGVAVDGRILLAHA